jgi:AcrR family transcriptional regulator
MPRPKLRTPQLRDQVISAAVELLGREGTAAFTARRLALEARTSTPAIYELFGDKGGVIHEMFFEGFRLLRGHLDAVPESADPTADLVDLVQIYRGFMRANPVLAQVMFSRPFSAFDPSRSELQASSSVRIFIVERVRRCIEAGTLSGDETDIAHALVALTQGLAAAENANRLGTTRASIDRRWTLAVGALLDGLRTPAARTPHS